MIEKRNIVNMLVGMMYYDFFSFTVLCNNFG